MRIDAMYEIAASRLSSDISCQERGSFSRPSSRKASHTPNPQLRTFIPDSHLLLSQHNRHPSLAPHRNHHSLVVSRPAPTYPLLRQRLWRYSTFLPLSISFVERSNYRTRERHICSTYYNQPRSNVIKSLPHLSYYSFIAFPILRSAQNSPRLAQVAELA
jgi:hypothetical protein